MKKSQVWIETVIYTLIGLAIIGVLLSIVKPAIEEKKDQLLIQKSLEMIQTIQDKVEEVVHYGTGNSRPVEVKLTKGTLTIDAQNNSIEFFITSSYMYSEPGQNISIGEINTSTIKNGNKYDVRLTLAYSNLDLTWNEKDTKQVFQPSPGSYKVSITNTGVNGNLTQVDFS